MILLNKDKEGTLVNIETPSPLAGSVYWRRYRDIAICLALAGSILLIFWTIQQADFINYDDNRYVYENDYVARGFSSENVKWAFYNYHVGYWHPLTWITFIFDYERFGLAPGGYHWTNVQFHIIGTLLLYSVLVMMTGARGKSFFVASLFALHPLHVESVAWISSRKDVLSGCWFMLTLMAYVHYAKDRNAKRYSLVLLFFMLGLMSKPILVTLPFVLLLLDYWPLKRFSRESVGKPGQFKASFLPAFLDKIPLLILGGLVSILTLYTTQRMGTVASLSSVSFIRRVENAVVSYGIYIRKAFLPYDLSIFYPYPVSISVIWVIFWMILLTGITALVIRLVREYPYLTVGWFWYLGTLLPVIGLLQAGEQAMADRYTYISLIGIFIIIAWGVPDLLEKRQLKPAIIPLSSTLVLLVFMMISINHVGYWKNDTTLFEHAIAVTKDNHLAHNALGYSLFNKGRIDDAIVQYGQALKIDPQYTDARINLGAALMSKDRINEAIMQFKKVLAIDSRNPIAHRNMGIALTKSGNAEVSLAHFKIAYAMDGDDADIHNNLGIAFAKKGDLREAANHFQSSLRLRPKDAKVRNNMGLCLANSGNLQEAIREFEMVLQIDPGFDEARKNLTIVKNLLASQKE